MASSLTLTADGYVVAWLQYSDHKGMGSLAMYCGLVPSQRDLMMTIVGKPSPISTSKIKVTWPHTASSDSPQLTAAHCSYLASAHCHAYVYAASVSLSTKALRKMAEPQHQLQHQLDPTIWSKLPHDIFFNIIEHSDLPTQINWSCTSRSIFPIASCQIWGSLRVRSSELTAYFSIVSGQRSTNHADGIVHFLLESSYRNYHTWKHVYVSDSTGGAFVHRPNGVEKYTYPKQITATLPVSRVQDLSIDNQGFDDQHHICNRFDMDHVLPTLLKRLPKLQCFTYVGPLSAKVLAAISQVDSLRVLHARNSNDVLEVRTTPTPNLIMPWIDLPLNWSVLAKLKILQVLEVGRLARDEALGLARGITSLNLKRLRLSCWGWEYKGINLSRPMRSATYTSALVIFLEALMTLDLRSEATCPGLPPTLEHLVLVDKYCPRIPSLHQLIATVITPCENLETLSTTISMNGRCYDAISKMGLPASDKAVGLYSWQQLSCEEEVKILHQYQSPSGDVLRTNPYPKPLRNIFRTLDHVIASAEGPGNYRVSMKFVKKRQFRSDEIIVYPCEGEDSPSAGERGPQAQDASMMDLAADFGALSLEEQWWVHLLRFWGKWSEW